MFGVSNGAVSKAYAKAMEEALKRDGNEGRGVLGPIVTGFGVDTGTGDMSITVVAQADKTIPIEPIQAAEIERKYLQEYADMVDRHQMQARIDRAIGIQAEPEQWVGWYGEHYTMPYLRALRDERCWVLHASKSAGVHMLRPGGFAVNHRSEVVVRLTIASGNVMLPFDAHTGLCTAPMNADTEELRLVRVREPIREIDRKDPGLRELRAMFAVGNSMDVRQLNDRNGRPVESTFYTAAGLMVKVDGVPDLLGPFDGNGQSLAVGDPLFLDRARDGYYRMTQTEELRLWRRARCWAQNDAQAEDVVRLMRQRLVRLNRMGCAFMRSEDLTHWIRHQLDLITPAQEAAHHAGRSIDTITLDQVVVTQEGDPKADDKPAEPTEWKSATALPPASTKRELARPFCTTVTVETLDRSDSGQPITMAQFVPPGGGEVLEAPRRTLWGAPALD